MRRYKDIFPHNHSKLSRHVLLLMATSSLFACNQANTNAVVADSATAEQSAGVVAQQTQSLSSQDTTPMSSSTVQSDLLKNVSVTVYKDANCGCCTKWVDYAKEAGMQAAIQHPNDLSLFKERYGVPQKMRSCHTTVTEDGYVFEGHIPAKYIAKFLKNPPEEAIGLAVPSMPVGSPGMEYQDKFLPYKVMQINKDGSTKVYAAIESPQQQL